MPNLQSICTSFKTELLNGHHAFGTSVARAGTSADTFKGALYVATGSLGAATTTYSATDEVSGTNYVAGGVTVTNGNVPQASGTTAHWTPSASLVYSSVTLSVPFDAVLIYNSTQGNKAVGVFTFPQQTITNGTLTLTMPLNDASNALLRLV